MNEDTLQEKYNMAKRMDEAYADMFEHIKNYYGPYELFKKSGMSYEQLLEAKARYEKDLFTELRNFLNCTMLENETGEIVELDAMIYYLELSIKSARTLRTKAKSETLPTEHCLKILNYFRNECHEALPY